MHPFNRDALLNLCVKTYYTVSSNRDPEGDARYPSIFLLDPGKKLQKSPHSLLTASFSTGIIIPVSQPV
jgi:hypothetical protein